MTASRAPDDSCFDVCSDECVLVPSTAIEKRGLYIVTHQGEQYVIVGIYMSSGVNGLPELRYVLRPMRHTREGARESKSAQPKGAVSGW